MRRVYLDNNATTPVAPEVFEAMTPWLTEGFGNASSIHWYGQQAAAAVEAAREAVAALLHAQAAEVVFTSGGTEADNTALFGVIEAAETASSAKHLVTTAIEHHAVLHSAKALENRGVRVTFVPVGPSGVVDPDDIRKAITADTVLISVMHANNELGTLQPIEAIGRIAQEHGIPFHTDAVQSAGKIALDVEKLGVSLLSLSAHKLNGPKGVGALYVRKGAELRPLLYGGGHERDRRAGTENVAGIVGFGAAAGLAMRTLHEEAVRLAKLRDRLEAGILGHVPSVRINGDLKRRVPNTSSVTFDFVEGEGLVIAADLQGLACSTGAACSSGSVESSHVLTAIGQTQDQARSTVRFSLGRFNTPEDIDYALEVIPQVVDHLRQLSPMVVENPVRM
ncbi:MAG: cysteine desulfurase family protein [Terriglobia bacterium]